MYLENAPTLLQYPVTVALPSDARFREATSICVPNRAQFELPRKSRSRSIASREHSSPSPTPVAKPSSSSPLPSHRRTVAPEIPHTAMSYTEWKREPTTMDVLFGLALPYRPPTSVVGKVFFRLRVWFEVSFAFSMLEPWEKVFVCVAVYLIAILLLVGSYLYLPPHLAYVRDRASYYLLGHVTSAT